MPFPLIPVIALAATVGASIWGAHKQAKENRKLAEYQNNANKELLQQQLDYNTPKNQMTRFQDAGLNSHLIYGQGSPGNQTSPLTYPDIKTTDYQRLMEAVPVFNQSRLTDSQVQAQNASTIQKYAMTELNKVQTDVMRRNPALNEGGFNAIIDSLKADVQIKANQINMGASQLQVQQASAGHQVEKVFREVALLDQRFKLSELDAEIKKKVLISQDFKNALLEVEKKFMSDGDVGPNQIMQFIMALLKKI